MAAEAAADNAMNADATGTEAHLTATAEARTALTLMKAAAAASRVISVMAAEAAADNADAVQVEQGRRHRERVPHPSCHSSGSLLVGP